MVIAGVAGDGEPRRRPLISIEEQVEAGEWDKDLETLKTRDGISERLLNVIKDRESFLNQEAS